MSGSAVWQEEGNGLELWVIELQQLHNTRVHWHYSTAWSMRPIRAHRSICNYHFTVFIPGLPNGHYSPPVLQHIIYHQHTLAFVHPALHSKTNFLISCQSLKSFCISNISRSDIMQYGGSGDCYKVLDYFRLFKQYWRLQQVERPDFALPQL